MLEFISLLFSFQMMPYTVPLFVILLYWILFMFGVAGDSDAAMDGVADAAIDGAVDGVADAAVDGIADAALDGAADAALDGAVDGAADAALDGAADAAVDGIADAAVDGGADSLSGSMLKTVGSLDSAGVLATADAVTEKTAPPKPGLVSNKRPKNLLGKVLEYLHIGEIPATIVLSILISLNWLYGYLSIVWIPLEGFTLEFPWIELIIRFVLITAVSILTGGLACRPLSRVFGMATVHVNEHLIGKPCRVKSSKVTGDFGEGELTIDGSYIIISLRTNGKKLWHEGDLATIVGYDEEKNVYYI